MANNNSSTRSYGSFDALRAALAAGEAQVAGLDQAAVAAQVAADAAHQAACVLAHNAGRALAQVAALYMEVYAGMVECAICGDLACEAGDADICGTCARAYGRLLWPAYDLYVAAGATSDAAFVRAVAFAQAVHAAASAPSMARWPIAEALPAILAAHGLDTVAMRRQAAADADLWADGWVQVGVVR